MSQKVLSLTNVEKELTGSFCTSVNWRYTAISTTRTVFVDGVTNVLPQKIDYISSTPQILITAVTNALGPVALAALGEKLDMALLLNASPSIDLDWEVTEPVEFDPSLYYTKPQVDALTVQSVLVSTRSGTEIDILNRP